MPKISEKRRMVEFIEDRLKTAGYSTVPQHNHLIPDIKTHYLTVADSGIILCISEAYTANKFNGLLNRCRREIYDIGVVFYKDGTTFFRAAAPKKAYKRRTSKNELELSLKHYSTKEIQNMIDFRPEEIRIYQDRNRRVQYYQPDSKMLNECIATFTFKPITYDYSHIGNDRFRPTNKESTRTFMWTDRKERDCPLGLYKGHLIPQENIEKIMKKKR